MFKSIAVPIAGVSIVLGVTWWIFTLQHDEALDLERTADEDADEALESIGENDKDTKGKKGKKGKKGDKGKAKGAEADEKGEAEGE